MNGNEDLVRSYEDEDFVTSYEAGLIIGRAPDTVRLLARRGRLATAIQTRFGRLYRRTDVEVLGQQLRDSAEARERRVVAEAMSCERGEGAER